MAYGFFHGHFQRADGGEGGIPLYSVYIYNTVESPPHHHLHAKSAHGFFHKPIYAGVIELKDALLHMQYLFIYKMQWWVRFYTPNISPCLLYNP